MESFGGFFKQKVLKIIEEEKLAFGDRNGEFGYIIVGGLHHGEFSALLFKHTVKKYNNNENALIKI